MKSKSWWFFTLILVIANIMLLARSEKLKGQLNIKDRQLEVMKKNLWQLYPKDFQMPSFSLSDIQGRMVHSDSLKGKLLLLTFFSIFQDCPDCVEKASKEWSKIYLKYHKQGLVALAIVDAPQMEILKISELIKKIPYPVLFDRAFQVKKKFGAMRTPTDGIVKLEPNKPGRILFLNPVGYQVDENLNLGLDESIDYFLKLY